MAPIDTPKSPEIPCGLKGCVKAVQPGVKKKKYCCRSHQQKAFAEKKFEAAVEARVQERLRELGITTDQKALES